jgi:hypothetical protein
MPAAEQPGLFIEQRGANLMIRLRGDTDSQEYSMFSAIPSLPGNTVLLTSIGALTSRDLSQAVSQAAVQALGALPGPRAASHRLWLALSGLGRPDTGVRPWPQRLADDLGVEVLAPQDKLSLIPGGLLFAGGDRGWRRFRRGDTSRPWGARHPQPDWEAQLPPGPVSAAGLTVESIPTGLLARPEGAPPTPPLDRAYAVAVHPGRPRLVLGRPGDQAPTPAQVAALVSMFPPTLTTALELVPHTSEVATTGWLTELAACLGREVRAASGLPLYGFDGRVHVIAHDIAGKQLLRHPATSLRYSPEGTVRVLESRLPPAGWVSAGVTVHRLPGALQLSPHELVAEVVPSGFALVPAATAGGPHPAALRPAEAHRLTITVGRPDAPLPPWAPDALGRLLSGLGPDARARLRVLVPAEITADEKQALFDVTALVEFAAEPEEIPVRKPISPVRVTSTAVPSARHHSTNAEQLEFRRLTGDRDGHADLAAVSHYLGSGEFGAVAVNSALRDGTSEPISLAYLACLTSGLRRLPAHRGVVFRQLRVPEEYEVGDVVSEPGFLSATAAENLAVPGGSADLLIWSRSGRRTTEVSASGLPHEIVFAAGTKVKVLSVQGKDLLLRELHPDETPKSRSLDNTDIAVLSKLLRMLRRRQATRLLTLEDQDQIARLAMPLNLSKEDSSGKDQGHDARRNR